MDIIFKILKYLKKYSNLIKNVIFVALFIFCIFQTVQINNYKSSYEEEKISGSTMKTELDSIKQQNDELQTKLSDYELKTPSIGITSVVYNQTKAQVTGSYRETDTQLRARRYLLLQGKATSVKKSIESAVKVVQNVQYAKVYENDTRQTVDGIPEKAFETVVSGGDDNLIANAIFTKKPIGIQAYGTTTVDIQDEDGDSVTIGFTRPTAIQCDLEIEYQVANLNEDQSWIDDLKSDLIAYFDGLDIGEDVYVYNMYCILQKYPKILNVTTFQAKKNTEDETKWADKVVIAKRGVARLLTDNITLTPSLQV